MTAPIIDWDDPEARIDLICRVGVARYNGLMLAHQRASVIETVHGYDIAPSAPGSAMATVRGRQ
jgi:hypothetical protein